MIRKRRKITRMRGTRTVGGGSAKKRRGAGNRGGRGMAGSHKHLWTWIVKYKPDHFGKRGFKRPKAVTREVKSINLKEIDEKLDELLEKNLAEEKNGMIYIDLEKLGYDKLLGAGQISRPISVKSPEISKKAKEKIIEAGGEIR
ncbi:LSU ribosomal protein L15P [Methanothermus fervidus DSM 2088]|uniref:Large ribosomal subunit protein uL15 n=1 Tax=Methanothermus fervidus (strain ATCC 43054 / DSM 2088 / JCM 10308 / V24 S) TaxID=523846 RepID=E3GZE1_METFV|nr:uL15 family ribosomal protein [Methanothermus fervidus]ADP77673.1 LSU ribosomal protein L15P [Methanothermus fervidus DSM 2088]